MINQVRQKITTQLTKSAERVKAPFRKEPDLKDSFTRENLSRDNKSASKKNTVIDFIKSLLPSRNSLSARDKFMISGQLAELSKKLGEKNLSGPERTQIIGEIKSLARQLSGKDKIQK